MLSKKKNHLFFVSVLIVLLSLSLFLVDAHAQYPFGPMFYGYQGPWGMPYQAYQPYPYRPYPYQSYPPYQPYPYQPYPYQQYPYQPYPYQQYPYQQYPYQQYPYQQYPYQQYPYQQYPYQQYPYQQYPYQQYPYYQPNYQQTDLMLDSSHNGNDYTVDKGDFISIILASNASTGYVWMLDTDEPDTDIVSRTSNQYFSGYGVGASGSEQWIFEAEDVGTTTIKLYYKRAWETTVQSTFEVEITVE